MRKLSTQWEYIFEIDSEAAFNAAALAVFQFQYRENDVYRRYCDLLGIHLDKITHYKDIPFLPISVFKEHAVKTTNFDAEKIFMSSGTTGQKRSQHYVKDLAFYETSFRKGFAHHYGDISDYLVLGLLPSYLEQGDSSLVYMVEDFINRSKHPESGLFLDNHEELNAILMRNQSHPTLLIGVSYALLDFGEAYRPHLSNTILMETGGMKGRRKEMIKSELHETLRQLYHVKEVHSEYGMTELLSQAYSIGELFTCPPWMKILTRSVTDPFQSIEGKTGGMNVIDLANVNSCAFIATQDLGKVQQGKTEILGRFDHSDVRGCNLLVQ